MRGSRIIPGSALLAIALLSIPDTSTSQETHPEPARAIWLSMGPAASPVADAPGRLGSMLQITGQLGGHQLSVRGTGMTPFRGTYPDEPRLREVGVLYGRAYRGPAGHVSAAVGVSRLQACQGPSSYPERCTVGAAMPMVLEAALSHRFVGVGVQGFAAFAGQHSHRGVSLFLQLGWLQ